MGVLLKEKYGLLTETGWYVDGNWMVNSRKLVGLLMEAVQQISFILGAWKCDFAEFRNPRFRGHLAFFNSFFPFWRLPNTIFTESWNPGFKTTKHRVSKFYGFWHPENVISDDSRYLKQGLKMRFAYLWNTRFKGTKFRMSVFSVLPILPHFGSMKMLFIPIRGTNVLRYLAKIEETLFIFHA